MLNDTLTINDGTVDVDFVKVKTTNDGTQRLNDATTLLEPESLIIRHQTVGGPNGTSVDRHLVQLSRTEIDDDNKPQVATVNLTLAVPRSPVFEAADLVRLITLMVNTVSTRVAEIARGES